MTFAKLRHLIRCHSSIHSYCGSSIYFDLVCKINAFIIFLYNFGDYMQQKFTYIIGSKREDILFRNSAFLSFN